MFKKYSILTGLSVLTVMLLFGVVQESGAAPQKEQVVIKLGEMTWDSARIDNAIVSFILTNGYGYRTESISGETVILWQGLKQGDVHVQLEGWPAVIPEAYKEAIDAGDVVKLGENYKTIQGWWVPRYMIDGDSKRGIKPLAPGLVYVDELQKYWETFKDPEVPTKGRIYIGVPGWGAEQSGTMKLETSGLDKYYNAFRAGSDAAQIASMVSAYERGKPWLGYYWKPSWPLATLDMVLLKEKTPYTDEAWNKNRGCEWPLSTAMVCVNAEWMKTSAPPEVIEFLRRFTTTADQHSTFLLYLNDHPGVSDKDVAVYFLKTFEMDWVKWMPSDVANKVKGALAK